MKASTKSIILFCVIAFIPVWLVSAVLLLLGMATGGVGVTLLFAAFMFMPAISSILTRLICREGFGDMYLRPHFRGNGWRYVLAWLLPIVLTLLGAVLFFLVYPALFDPSFSLLTSQGIPAAQLPLILAVNGILMLLGPVLNLIPAFGEELGWRGYLLPKLALRMGRQKATLLSGAIWGLWHAPMIALGHNFGFGYAGYPWTGILLMTLFCILFGSFLSWLTFKSSSAIPAALAHGGLNAVAAAGIMVSLPSYNALMGPAPVGLIGGIPVLITGILFFCLLAGKAENKG
jgi:membrane protease YdiL (CAAX protease family)